MLQILAAHRRPALLLLRVVLWIAMAVGLYEALRPVPVGPPGQYADKIEHFVCFYLLTGAALLAYPRLKAAWLVAIAAACGAGVEALQSLPAIGRDAEFLDWVADMVGVFAALGPALTVPPVREALDDRRLEP